MPGQKRIHLAKKGSGPSFPNADFRRCQPSYPVLAASLCGKEAKRNREGLIPSIFVFGDRTFTRAT